MVTFGKGVVHELMRDNELNRKGHMYGNKKEGEEAIIIQSFIKKSIKFGLIYLDVIDMEPLCTYIKVMHTRKDHIWSSIRGSTCIMRCIVF